jgi:hypothetical protein
MRFTVSARGKRPDVPVLDFLAQSFAGAPLTQIDSVFGFVEPSTLYGGRIFVGPELSPRDVDDLYSAGVGLRLPLTNHYVTAQECEVNAPLLEKYHRPGNAAIVTNDDLAAWIRRHFPNYRLEASVIKNLKSHRRIEKALDLYDTVVLPMEINQDEAFLDQVANKERITLFANAGCALTCPARICYASVSRINKTGRGLFMCSQRLKQRDLRGMIDFDLDRLQELGFSRFKLLRARPGGMTGY